MKKLVLIISLIIMCTGCFNYNELNDYAIATGMAIDRTNNGYEVSMLISNLPKSSNTQGGKDYRTVVYSGKGKTIYEAIKQIGLISPKELYIGHLSILIISDSVAKKGINSSLEFLLEEPRSKKNFQVAIAKDSKAKDILSITSPLTDFPSQNLATNLKVTTTLQGSVSTTDFNTVLYKLINNGIDLTLSGFHIVGSISKGVKNSNMETNNPKAYIKLSPLAIFKGDKLVNWASINQSKGINIINNNIKELYLNIKCNNGYIVVNIEDIDTKKYINKNGNITIKTKGKSSISEINCNLDLTNQDNINKIEKKIENKIRKLELEAITLSKKYNTDIFGIGILYYGKYPKQYNSIKNYDTFYKNIKFNIKNDIKINTSGSIKQTLERIENEKNN